MPEPADPTWAMSATACSRRQLSLLPVSGTRVHPSSKGLHAGLQPASRWLGAELLTVGDLAGYESELVSEWRRRFSVMCDELGPAAAEEEMQREAKQFYKWFELEADFPSVHGAPQTSSPAARSTSSATRCASAGTPTSRASWPGQSKRAPHDDSAGLGNTGTREEANLFNP